MTTVRIDLRGPAADGVDRALPGAVEWVPLARRHVDVPAEEDGDHVVLEVPFNTRLPGPEAAESTVDVVLAPGYWQADERVEGGTTRVVLVPESAGVVDYGDLVEIDPATLEPVAEPEAAWYVALAAVQAALEEVQAGQVPPEQIEAAVVAYLTENPVEGVTQQQLEDAIAAVELLPGADGASAYDVAVAAGFVGTQAQWLASLVGPPGDDGEPGSDGGPGPSTEWRSTATHLQSRPVGGTTWTDVVALSAITGPPGDDGPPGATTIDGIAGLRAELDELRATIGALGMPVVKVTAAEYAALDPVEPDVLYVVKG